MVERIITHNDFDGIVSAAFCMSVFNVDTVWFAGPSQITENREPISPNDVICDLPYSSGCGMWFDHHEGNLKSMLLLGIDPSTVPGAFAPEKSCARVIYEYFSREYEFPEDFDEMVEEADRIDSFSYGSIEEWRKISPAHVINDAIKVKWGNPREKNQFLYQLVTGLCDTSLAEVAETQVVQKLWQSYKKTEEKMLSVIKEKSYFHETDPGKEILIIDLTDLNKQPFIIKNLSYLLYPDILAALQIQNLYRNSVKTNDVSFSISLSIKMNNQKHGKNLGEIMRILNMGDGHTGAASGLVRASSKTDMEKNKMSTITRIIELWQTQ